MASILDFMDEDPASPDGQKKRRNMMRLFAEAYPDYAKSLVRQQQASPAISGATEAVGYGTLGAVLGALVGRLTEQDRNKAMLLAVLGGMLGGGAGFYAGKKGQEMENSKLLFLRRMGVGTPGELEAMSAYPGLARKLTEEDVKL